MRINHAWAYHHRSGITLRELHPNRPWYQTQQDASTQRSAAEHLVTLHLEIEELTT